VTQPAVDGPLSCFDTAGGGPGERVLEVDLSDSVDDGGGRGGYLASAMTDRTGAGSAGCPWLLRASPWQRINVTLIDFSDSTPLDGATEAFGYSVVLGETAGAAGTEHIEELHPATDVDGPGDHSDRDAQLVDSDGGMVLQELQLRTFCHKYAVVRERQTTTSRETVVCGDTARRKVVYLSAGNEIEVELVRAASDNDDAKQPAVFLLQYESQYLRSLSLSVFLRITQNNKPKIKKNTAWRLGRKCTANFSFFCVLWFPMERQLHYYM